MFTHVMLGANDLAASKKFYDAVLGAIGLPAGQADPKGRIFYRTKSGVFGITKPIDGQPATQQLNGYAATCSAVWDGNDIIATTNMEGVGLKFTDRMSLSADGKTLTSKVQISSNQGEGELTIVFDRQ